MIPCWDAHSLRARMALRSPQATATSASQRELARTATGRHGNDSSGRTRQEEDTLQCYGVVSPGEISTPRFYPNPWLSFSPMPVPSKQNQLRTHTVSCCERRYGHLLIRVLLDSALQSALPNDRPNRGKVRGKVMRMWKNEQLANSLSCPPMLSIRNAVRAGRLRKFSGSEAIGKCLRTRRKLFTIRSLLWKHAL